jgi:hypothetical protein
VTCGYATKVTIYNCRIKEAMDEEFRPGNQRDTELNNQRTLYL